jgi:hypothetical protein
MTDYITMVSTQIGGVPLILNWQIFYNINSRVDIG